MDKDIKDVSIVKKIYKKYRIKRYLYLFIGLLLFAISFNMFWIPNDFVFGGVSGLSVVVQDIFGIQPSDFIFVTSIILLVISYIVLGKEKTIGSILGSLLLPVFIRVTATIIDVFPAVNYPLFPSMLFGSVLSGIGIGIAFKGGFTTGGTDIVNQIVSKYCKISIGKAVIFDDGLIVLLGAYVFGLNRLLYSLVGLYLMSYFIDKVLLGISDCKTFYIVTKKEEEISDYIINTLRHTVTVFSSFSGKDDEKHTVLFSVIPTREYFILKEKINDIDKKSFVLSTDAYQVYGGEYEKIN